MELADSRKSSDEHRDELGDVTREELYTLVWAEPMLKVAPQFDVSSSYMARICRLMNVPRPERGYWAKLAVGKGPPKRDLPEARPGDQVVWNRSGAPQTVKRLLPRPPAARPKRKPKVAVPRSDFHPVVQGARAHFDVDRTYYDSSYLKPAKRILVDLVVSKTGLDKALSFANQLFLELEAHHCRVLIAAHGERMHREEVDAHEIPRRKAERQLLQPIMVARPNHSRLYRHGGDWPNDHRALRGSRSPVCKGRAT